MQYYIKRIFLKNIVGSLKFFMYKTHCSPCFHSTYILNKEGWERVDPKMYALSHHLTAFQIMGNLCLFKKDHARCGSSLLYKELTHNSCVRFFMLSLQDRLCKIPTWRCYYNKVYQLHYIEDLLYVTAAFVLLGRECGPAAMSNQNLQTRKQCMSVKQ